MAVRFNGSSRLTYSGRLYDNLDVILVVWGGQSPTGTTEAWVSQSQASRDDRYNVIAPLTNGNVTVATAWATGQSAGAVKTGPTLNATMRLGMGVFRTSGTNRSQCYYGDNSQGNSTDAITDQVSNHDTVTIGAMAYNNTIIWPLNGDVAEFHAIAVGSRTDADIDTLYDTLAAGGLPEDEVGWIDGWILYDNTDLTSIGGTRTLTTTGTVTTSPAAHPITRTPSGFTLPADQGSLALTGQDAGLRATRVLTAEFGSYALTGQTAVLQKDTPGQFTLQVDAGSYSWNGQDALADYAMNAEMGSFALTGQEVTFSIGVPAAYTLSVDPGYYTFNGQNARLDWSGAPIVPNRQAGIYMGMRIGL